MVVQNFKKVQKQRGKGAARVHRGKMEKAQTGQKFYPNGIGIYNVQSGIIVESWRIV